MNFKPGDRVLCPDVGECEFTVIAYVDEEPDFLGPRIVLSPDEGVLIEGGKWNALEVFPWWRETGCAPVPSSPRTHEEIAAEFAFLDEEVWDDKSGCNNCEAEFCADCRINLTATVILAAIEEAVVH